MALQRACKNKGVAKSQTKKVHTSTSTKGNTKRKAANQSLPGPRCQRLRDSNKLLTSSIADNPLVLPDIIVAESLVASTLPWATTSDVLALMHHWTKPILKAAIPGITGRRKPSMEMMDAAKRAVLRFYAKEEAQGIKSHVVQAFYLVSGEPELHFDWASARAKVRRAKFDRIQEIDVWNECLAMSYGDTTALSEIFVCGTRPLTLRALTSLLAHEGLHNLVRRKRQGNPFLSEETEHKAMAMIGDPQLVQPF